jgi:hypothetical protein
MGGGGGGAKLWNLGGSKGPAQESYRVLEPYLRDVKLSDWKLLG